MDGEPTQSLPHDCAAAQSVEIQLIDEGMKDMLRSSILILVLVFASLFIPSLSHAMRASIVITLIIFAYYLHTIRTILSASDYARKLNHSYTFSFVMHTLRITASLWCWAFHSNSNLLKFGTLYVLPLSAVRNAHDKRHFLLYLTAHLIVTLLRCKNDGEDGYPILITSFINARFLYEIAAQKELQRKTRVDLATSMIRAVEMSKATTRTLFEGFCDAFAPLSSDLRLLENSERLATLIGRRAPKGKLFSEFVTSTDLDEFEEHMRQVKDVFTENTIRPTSSGGIGSTIKVQARSFALHLDSQYNEPIPMHLFHSCLQQVDQEVVIFIGISEAWAPKKEHKGSRPKRTSNAAKFDFNTGQLVPGVPLYSKADAELLTLKTAERSDKRERLNENSVLSGQPSLRQRRPDSPRLEKNP